jgi:putative transposase
MYFEENNLYHIYNRGNNKQTIFFTRENYLYFLNKIKKYISPHCNIIAWCLMPNHFHFLIQGTEDTTKIVKQKPIEINALTKE